MSMPEDYDRTGHFWVKAEDVVNTDLWRAFPVINVDRVKDIPCDYPGAMGVPITFLDKWNREQFEVLDCIRPKTESKVYYRRIMIRNLHPELPEWIDFNEYLEKTGAKWELGFINKQLITESEDAKLSLEGGSGFMKQKSIKNIRQEFKDKGIFYTPQELAEKIKSYVDIEPADVYDPTCGAGNLLRAFPDDARKYGQELDAEQLELAKKDIRNFTGYAGDTLTDDGFSGMTFECIVANPPFSVKWDPDALRDDPRFSDAPCMPPPSKADWAYMLHCLYHLKENGIAVVLCFPGILYRGQREGKIRRWFVEKNYIERIVNIPGNTFEDTSINTCIVVLKRNRKSHDIIFEDGERSREVSFQEITDNDFNLSVNIYLPEDVVKEKIDIDAVNRQVVETTLKNTDTLFEAIIEIKKVCPEDNLYIMDLYDGMRNILRKHERDVWMLELREADE